jgi:hypothetical protein
MAVLLGFAAYTGWRHVGVIDPSVWRAYDAVFPVLILFCALVAWSVLTTTGSLAAIMEQGRTETVLQLGGLFNAAWVAALALSGWIALVVLRRKKIAALDATVGQLLAPLAEQAGAAAVKAADVPPVNKGRGLVIGGAGLLLLLAYGLAPVPGNERLAELYFRSAQYINLLGFFLLVRARRYFQVQADSLLAVDRRPPILFLRSFDDDEKQQFASSQKALLDFSLETRLSNHFFRFGPFVAIGSPKETLPQPGAARVLLGDDEWQGRVLDWMQNANLIIMYSGMTKWVNWELRQVVESGRATSLILMFPEIKAWRSARRKASVEGRAERIREVFQDTPWKEELAAFSDFDDLRAMLFRADGSMVMVRSRSRSRDAYHLAALVAHQQLLFGDAPVPAAAASTAKARPRSSTVTVGAMVAAVVIVGAINLFQAPAYSVLPFGQGELYYGEQVTADEARSVGQYLVAQEYFSDDHPSTVQLHRDRDRYRLQFVIDPQYAERPLTIMQFGLLGGRIARDVLGGERLEVALADDRLNPIRTVPLTALLLFKQGELFYTEPVTAAEAQAVGELLVQTGYFDDDTGRTVALGGEDGAYQLKFVVDPARALEPEIVSAFRELSRLIVEGAALGGRAVLYHLCDDEFRSLHSERL